jgi:hypothetical protein
MKNWDITVIATTTESYISLYASWGVKEDRRQIVFLDSLQFLHASLASLAQNCPATPLADSLPWPQHVKRGKGVFPYSYLDNEDKLLDTTLPPIDDFHDALTNTALKEEEYRKAQDAWSAMECQTFGEYMMSKLITNLLQ